MTPLPAEQEGGPTLWQCLSHNRLPVEYVPWVALAMVVLWVLVVRLASRWGR